MANKVFNFACAGCPNPLWFWTRGRRCFVEIQDVISGVSRNNRALSFRRATYSPARDLLNSSAESRFIPISFFQDPTKGRFVVVPVDSP
jgi:hypothetical protein